MCEGKSDRGSSPRHHNGYLGFSQNVSIRLHFIQHFSVGSYTLQVTAGQADPTLESALATGRIHWKVAANSPSAPIFNAENQSSAVYHISRAQGSGSSMELACEAGLFSQCRFVPGGTGNYLLQSHHCFPSQTQPRSAAGTAIIPREPAPSSPGLQPNPKCPPACMGAQPTSHPPPTSHQPQQKIKEQNTPSLCYTIKHHKCCTPCSYCTYRTWELNSIFFSPTYWHFIY